jgi:hypothetical protein
MCVSRRRCASLSFLEIASDFKVVGSRGVRLRRASRRDAAVGWVHVEMIARAKPGG